MRHKKKEIGKRRAKAAVMVAVAMAVAGEAMSQTPGYDQLKELQQKTEEAQSNGGRDYARVMIGLGAGASISSLSYSAVSLSAYDVHSLLRGAWGGYLQVALGSWSWALRPQIAVVGRGAKLTYEDIAYRLKSKYVDLRLPLIYRLPVSDKMWPYIMVAPHLDFTTGGSITYDDYSTHVALTASTGNMSSVDAGLIVGGGLEWAMAIGKFPIEMGVEAGYNIGLGNTFALSEQLGKQEQGEIRNNFVGAQLWEGTRKNRGMEVTAHVSVPLDGKYVRRRKAAKEGQEIRQTEQYVAPQTDRYTTPQAEQPKVTRDTLIIHDTIYLNQTPANIERQQQTLQPMSSEEQTWRSGRVEVRATEYRAKNNMTMAELLSYVDDGVDISSKRIVLQNITFDYNSYALSFEMAGMLLDLVRIMRDYPEMTIEVYGHTDASGNEEYNQRLSENRAYAVASYITAYGIEQRRVKVVGMGKRYPAVPEYTEADKARNRRVEIEITHMGKRRQN